jgi:selenocysteine lyase/cysteine desulfurase
MLPCQRELFDIPADIAYLNCAYMSPLMKNVVDTAKTGVERKAHPWLITPTDFYTGSEEFRRTAARLFGATADDIAIVSSASYGVAVAAANLPVKPGQRILLLEEQFPSNVYSWRRLAQDAGAEVVTVPWPEDDDWTTAVLSHLDERVAIAALPHVQWASGGLLDLVKIGEACRHLGAALALDLTQSLGAYPFDARAVQPDFAVAACYKWLLSPYTLGVMYVAPKWQQQGRPIEENWIAREKSDDFASLVLYQDGYQPGARRFDMGERSNFALVPAATRALQQILAWGVDEISAYSGALNRKLAAAACELGWMSPPEELRAPHYLCLRSGTTPDARLLQTLAKEKIYVSVRGRSMRVAPHVYNTEEEVERLLEVLRRQS